ncbi:Periplasmic serine proteases (ClpP class) [Methylophaga frappieri]|uniref:Periplasmic serine proteases (ClpP class) n=1 Tax=Methylophaga frappieri (strain ATCC BAA-2434 / DSM 25690 / JAM7) TaxID=754477 RepID=I1YHQ5_METFJ|nr:S49 family peptidase [Methylophaga frappieri]AFJ02448.1 Periplasmic serine proteases (ClpP class) [Methylophaga frappieri]
MATFGDFPPQQNTSTTSEKDKADLQWERQTLRDIAFAAIREQRNSRRWGYVFKGLILLYLFAFLFLMMPGGSTESAGKPHTALVEISGLISADSEANADRIVTGIRNAFDSTQAKALILRLNTPGGSPVQSGIINDEIRRLRSTRPDFPVYAVIQDICASGGYYIAVAADEIYADKASIVGSIGVRMDSFGFTEAIDKLGIERRSLTAGENKAFLDPFKPLQPNDIDHANAMLQTIHQQFIDVVIDGRGERINANNSELFSGLFWSGEQSLELGLIDGLASSSQVARDKVGAEEIIDYTPRPNYLDRFAGTLGASIGSTLRNTANWSLQ